MSTTAVSDFCAKCGRELGGLNAWVGGQWFHVGCEPATDPATVPVHAELPAHVREVLDDLADVDLEPVEAYLASLAAQIATLERERDEWKHESLCLGEFAASYNRDHEIQMLLKSSNELSAALAAVTAERDALRMEGCPLTFPCPRAVNWAEHHTREVKRARAAESTSALLREALTEYDRLSLIIESSVRFAGKGVHEPVLAAIKAGRAALKGESHGD